MAANPQLHQPNASPLFDVQSYKKLIGKLLYLCNTGPEICFAVQLSQFLDCPTTAHLQAARRVL